MGKTNFKKRTIGAVRSVGIGLFILLSLNTLWYKTFAQNAYAGTDFWIGFIPNESGGSSFATLKLSITAAAASTATITIPLASPVWSTTAVITANGETIVTIPSSTGGVALDNETINAVSNAGIHIVSDNPVSIYGISQIIANTDAWISIPTANVGTDYISYAPVGNAEFMAVATADATSVTFTLPAGKASTGQAAGATWSVTLNQGQTFLVRSAGAQQSGDINDLTGTIIHSDKPIALMSGSGQARYPDNGNRGGYVIQDSGDMLVEQLTPTSTWGKKYVAAPFYNNSMAIDNNINTFFRVVTSSSGTTTFNITGFPTQTLTGKGNYMDYKSNTGTVITSDQPIAVYQMGGSCQSPLNPGDPLDIALVPVEQWGVSSPLVTADPSVNYFSNRINVIAKKSNPNITLDGAALTSFIAIGTSGYYYKPVSVAGGTTASSPGGIHLVSSPATPPDTFMVDVYGYATAEGYAYSAAGPTLLPINLPISLVEFKATLKNNLTVLNWTTANEKNTSHFVIERSTDGLFYTPISSNITAADNSNVQHTYSYTDSFSTQNTPPSTRYYRLKQVDFNGKYIYSYIVSVRSNRPFGEITVSPQPVNERFSLTLNISQSQNLQVSLYNILGKMLSSKSKAATEGLNTFEFDFSEEPQGIYFLQIQNEQGESQQIKLLKQ